MKLFVVLCAVAACAFAKPSFVNYGDSAIAPLHHYAPYSIWGGLAATPLAYSAVHTTPLVHSAPIVHSAPVVHAVAPAIGLKSQYHAQDELGQASYGHAEPAQVHHAVQDAAGNKIGSFSFVQADGSIARTDYVADALGYRVASNNLPVAPLEVPAPVVDTPEVVAARAAHLAEVEKAKTRSKREVVLPAATSPLAVSPVVSHVAAPVVARVGTPFVGHYAYPYAAHTYAAYPYSFGYPWAAPVAVTPSGHIADTPEVAAAKIAHFAEVEKAKSRSKRAIVYSNPLVHHTAYSTYAAPALTTAYAARPLTYSTLGYSHLSNFHYYK